MVALTRVDFLVPGVESPCGFFAEDTGVSLVVLVDLWDDALEGLGVVARSDFFFPFVSLVDLLRFVVATAEELLVSLLVVVLITAESEDSGAPSLGTPPDRVLAMMTCL